MYKINPEWTRFNDLINEGGEGYNPHPKYIATAPQAAAATVRATGKVYRDERGVAIDPAALLAECEARLTRLTCAFAIEIAQESIAKYRAMLAEG